MFTSPCVSIKIYQQRRGDIDGDVTPVTWLQYQSVHWVMIVNPGNCDFMCLGKINIPEMIC